VPKQTCCFIGNRHLPVKGIQRILLNLDREIDHCISNGVSTFICGGALGFDQIAASFIIAKKGLGKKIRLIFVLPCKNQDRLWNMEKREFFKDLLNEADNVVYIAENTSHPFISEQNRYIIEQSSYCICALQSENSETIQIMQFVKERGLRIVNIAE